MEVGRDFQMAPSDKSPRSPFCAPTPSARLAPRPDGWSNDLGPVALVPEAARRDAEAAREMATVRRGLRHSLARPGRGPEYRRSPARRTCAGSLSRGPNPQLQATAKSAPRLSAGVIVVRAHRSSPGRCFRELTGPTRSPRQLRLRPTPQRRLLDLAGTRARHVDLADRENVPRDLVARQRLAAELP